MTEIETGTIALDEHGVLGIVLTNGKGVPSLDKYLGCAIRKGHHHLGDWSSVDPTPLASIDGLLQTIEYIMDSSNAV